MSRLGQDKGRRVLWGDISDGREAEVDNITRGESIEAGKETDEFLDDVQSHRSTLRASRCRSGMCEREVSTHTLL